MPRRDRRAGRRDQQQQPDHIRDEARSQQEGAAEDHERAVQDLAVRHAAGRERLAERRPCPAALRAQQPRAHDRVDDQERHGRQGADRLADLDDHVDLRDRHEDEEQDQERHGRQGSWLPAQPSLQSRAWPKKPTQASAPDRDDVWEALENVIDPELGLDFVSLGLVYDVELEGNDVHITFTLTSPGCPIGPQVTEQMKEFVSEVEGVEKVLPEDDLLAAVVPGEDVRGREVRARVLDASSHR